MKIALIGEGETEFDCLPTMAGRLGNVVVRCGHIGGADEDTEWGSLIERKVAPLVASYSLAQPEKIVVVLDREGRAPCCGNLAAEGVNAIRRRCGYLLGTCGLTLVMSNRRFEALLFSDYDAVDSLPVLRGRVSHQFPEVTDEHNVVSWVHEGLRAGLSYDKRRDGKFLAQRMRLEHPDVLRRNKSLRKLIKELSTL